MKKVYSTLAFLLATLGSSANAIELTSKDIKEGHHMSNTFEFSGWGCTGKNLSPQLAWNDLPKGTKSLALTVYDPDAPTGSGFWHWLVTDLPADLTELKRGADVAKLGAKQYRNDYGNHAFGGACPPAGDGMHRYQFTLWAMPVTDLGLGKDTPAAVVGFQLNAKALAKKTITATYNR